MQQWMSDYMESGLPADEMAQAAKHLESCGSCSRLLDEMRSVVSWCHRYPTLEMDPDLLERILLRTSGRPRTRSLRERLHQYFVRPLFVPRFAAGAILATLFLALTVNLLMPRLSSAWSALSPTELLRLMDRGVHELYGEGLKAYDTKNEWQARFDRFKNNTLNNLRFMMEQIEIPVEGRKKSEEPMQEKQTTPREKSSGLLLWPA
jgi:hypothetical protein